MQICYPVQHSTTSDGVTQDVVREAEALMRRHASQPEFLLQLFRHAAQITVHTDQHVAVALLQDLASQPHRPDHGYVMMYFQKDLGSSYCRLQMTLICWHRLKGTAEPCG